MSEGLEGQKVSTECFQADWKSSVDAEHNVST